MRAGLLRFALLALLALPSVARAGDVSMVVRDVPLGPRSLQVAQPPPRFDMLGVHWRGPGTVSYRTHRIGGGWTRWVAADADTGPDARSPEAAATRGWHDGVPDWVGASDAVRFRTHGRVERLRAYYLWSRVRAVPLRTPAVAAEPLVAPRFSWGANEKIVRARPQYAPALRLAIVHHTVNTNAYTRAQAPAIIRGIQTYHVKGNGWNDIGYNFLIDRFGQVWEGRAGGIDRNVIGAHSAGFNTGSVGIALIGTYGTAAPTTAQQQALVDLLAWRLDVAHVDPLAWVTTTSLGNSKFRRGSLVRLRAISGHRDTYFTACPGTNLYGRLPAVAAAVAQTGLPKIYDPVASGDPTEGVRFTARLSTPAAWTVTVTDSKGAVVGSGKGTGSRVDWPWFAPRAGTYAWSIQSDGARPAAGVLGSGRVVQPALPALSGLAAAPGVLAPDPAGLATTAHASFVLGKPAQVTVQIADLLGKVVQTLVAGEQMAAGKQLVDWYAAGVPDGRYRLVVTARPANETASSAAVDLVVDRTLTALATTAQTVSPNGDGVQDTATFSFVLAAAVPLRLDIRRNGLVVATLYSGIRGPGPQVVDWSGKDAAGAPMQDGAYELAATASGPLGAVTTTLPLVVDTVAPSLALLDARVLRFSLSEPAGVTVTVNGVATTLSEPAGVFTLPVPAGGVHGVTAQARDNAGNASAVVSG